MERLMSDLKWRVIDKLNKPYYLDDTDYCVYAREHVDGGYEVSESNKMIFNYKKPISYKNTPQWYYKNHSIGLFASELNLLKFPKNSILIPAPTSKPRTSPLFDSRIDDTLERFIEYRDDLIIQKIIDVTEELRDSHSEGGTRNPDYLSQFITVYDFTIENLPERVFYIDDMITSGGHFKACKTAFHKKYPDIKFIGVFWARHFSSL